MSYRRLFGPCLPAACSGSRKRLRAMKLRAAVARSESSTPRKPGRGATSSSVHSAALAGLRLAFSRRAVDSRPGPLRSVARRDRSRRALTERVRHVASARVVRSQSRETPCSVRAVTGACSRIQCECPFEALDRRRRSVPHEGDTRRGRAARSSRIRGRTADADRRV